MRQGLVILVLACSPAVAQAPGDSLRGRVTIHRDTYGIPHVFGETDAATLFGFAYAQAEDHFFRIEDNYIRALGRLAEVEGERALGEDYLTRALEIPRISRAEYERLTRHLRGLLDAFAAGLNAYLADHPEVRPRLLAHMEPWYPLAFIRYVYYQNGFLRQSGLRPADLPVAVHDLGPRPATGSNGWVVGPRKSASGHPLLFINPHLPYFGPGQVYEGHIKSDQGWNFTGYTRFGFPIPYVGHNEFVGWVSTDNAADVADLYLETFDHPTRPLLYRYGTGYRMATEWSDTILVKTDTGVERRAFTFRKTHHGPIVGVRDGRPLAVRLAKLDGYGWFTQWYAMTRARWMLELRQAMQPLNMLFGNIMAADVRGNIWYLYNAAVPRRDPRFDWTRPLEGSDPQTDWRGFHTLDELPQLFNPATGWMQNCNTTPFLLTESGNPDSTRYPRYMVPEGDNWRGLMSRRILGGRETFTWDDWVQAAFDTYVPSADSLLPALFAAAGADSARAARLGPALDVLRAWDRRADTAAVAMTVYDRWLEARDGGAGPLDALDSALARLEREWGTWRVPWGEVNRLQRLDERAGETFSDARASIAVAGAPGRAGAVFTYQARPVPGQKRRYGVAGGSYVSVVEFGPTIRALAVHAMGASGDPRSPHYFDQAPLFARGRFRPAWFTVEEIRANLEKEYRP